MRLLALETSTEYCSCALNLDGDVRESCVLAGQRHSELLLPMVGELMAQAGLAFSQLDVIAFGAGPGSFTGLRIACGAAQGLAFAYELPVVPVVTLEALAEASGANRVLACLDARLGELYLAAYERAGGNQWKVVAEPALLKTDALPALTGAWVGVGSGFAAHASALEAKYALDDVRSEAFPHATAVARLGAMRYARGQTVAADAAVPLYLRDKVALDVHEQAALRAERRMPSAGGVAA
jgi:tRNA threonylcarbamoyladenosine biosynthesis protein TsaB